MDWQALIEAQPALAQIPAQLRAHARRTETHAGQVLARSGDRVLSMLSVISGEVRLVRRGRSGNEVILQRSRGGFFAESSLDHRAYHCDVVAAEQGSLVRFPVPAFRAALAEDKTFQAAWTAHLSREVRKLRAQCERLSLHGAAERILHYLESEGADGAVVLGRSRKAWASELGLTHEALYRTLSRLQADSTLHVEGKRVAIVRR